MASCITSQWSNSTSPQVRLTVDAVNVNSSTTNLNWKLEYVGHGYPPHSYGGRAYSVTVAGETVASGNYDINGLTGTYTIASGTKQVTRSTSNQKVSFSLSFAFNLTWTGVYSGTRSASGSITVPARPSNTYSFNANGGSGAPSAVTKWGGINFTFPTGRPSRAGHTFNGWFNSGINNGALYQPGQTVSNLPDQAVIWYAKWTAYTYTVKYNANGGSGAPGQQTKTYGVTLTLSSTKPTRTNYTFKGWGTSSGSTTVAYAAGGSYTKNASITLYAIWQLNYTKPSITTVSVDRCNSAGTPDDEGTYAKVSFHWSIASTATISSITIGYKLQSSSSYTNVSVSASGRSGTVNRVIGGSFNTESTYDVRITVTDSKGSSYRDRIIYPMSFILDVSPQGGVAFGGPAPSSNNTQFYNSLIMSGKNIYMNDAAALFFKDGSGENSIYFQAGGADGVLNLTATQLSLIAKLFVNQVGIRQNMPLMLQQTGGTWFTTLKMNTSNQVELYWTSGGLKGRVRKQLWAGTWSSGSLTLSELPYYNQFLIGISGNSSDNVETALIYAVRSSDGSRITGLGTGNLSSVKDIRTVSVELAPSGTSLKYNMCNYHLEDENGNVVQRYSNRKIFRIFGLL